MLNLNIYTWLAFWSGLFFVIFGFVAYLKDRKNLSNKLFGLLSLSFAFWTVAWFIMLLIREDENLAIFWAKVLNFGAIWIPIFFLHWVLAVLGLNKKRKILIFIGYLVALAFSLFSFSSLYIKGVHSIFFFIFWPTAGPLYKWYLLFGYFGMVGYALYELIKGFIKNSGEQKYRISYIIVACLLGFLGGATNFPLMYGLNFIQPVGLFTVVLSPIIFFYAAARHRLMNIRLISTELFAGIMMMIFLTEVALAGSWQQMLVRFPIFIASVVFAILLIRSVLKEVRLREKIEVLAKTLESANEKLKQLDEAKDEFISLASHQLRAPLTAIKGYSSMLLEGSWGQMSDLQKKQLGIISISCDNLIMLVEDMLTLSRIQAGKLQFDFESADLEKAVREVVDSLSQVAQSRGLYLNFHKPETSLSKIKIDVLKIKQIIQNLIDNAIHYTEKGGMDIYLEEKDDKIIFSIKDTGIGIDKEDQDDLFEKFSRGAGGKLTYTGGTGLGLYLAAKVKNLKKLVLY